MCEWRQFFGAVMFEGKKVLAWIYQILLLDLFSDVKFGCTYFFLYPLYPGTKSKKTVLVFFNECRILGK